MTGKMRRWGSGGWRRAVPGAAGCHGAQAGAIAGREYATGAGLARGTSASSPALIEKVPPPPPDSAANIASSTCAPAAKRDVLRCTGFPP